MKYRVTKKVCFFLCSLFMFTVSVEGRMKSFSSPAAHQGVGVDSLYIYAVSNNHIIKYNKNNFSKVKEWKGAEDGPLAHLNAGIVFNDTLVCTNSNYPKVPMASSLEFFDTKTLTHIGSHSFGIFAGSATWVDRYDGKWYVIFAHYMLKGVAPGKNPNWTACMVFDAKWRLCGGYAFPQSVIKRFAPYSCSGGAIGEDGTFYVTGHDRAEVYALSIPLAGPYLQYERTIEVPFHGQGIARDRWVDDTLVLWGIVRKDKKVYRTLID